MPVDPERRRHVAGRTSDWRGADPRYLEALQPPPRGECRRALGTRGAGNRSRRAERQAQAAQPPVRAGHLHGQPGDRWRNDGKQLGGRAIGALRQNNRSRARAAGRAVGRFDGASASTRYRGAGARVRGRIAGGAMLPRGAAHRARSRGRDRAAVPQGTEARRRLQSRCLRRSLGTVQPRQADRRLRGHARHRPGGEGLTGAVAQSEGRAGHRVRRAARRAGGGTGNPRAPTVGNRGDGQVHPRSHQAERRARSTPAHVHQRRSRRAALRRVLRRKGRGPATSSRGARARPCRALGTASVTTAPSMPRRRARSGRCARRHSGCRWR